MTEPHAFRGSGTSERPSLKRVPMVLIDQVVNSGTNLLVVLLIARQSSVREFGVFATSQSLLLLLQVTFAAGAVDLLLRASLAGSQVLSAAVARIGRVVLGPLLAVAGLVVLLPLPQVGAVVIAAVLTAGPIGVSDYARAHRLLHGRTREAVLVDSALGGLQVGAAVLLLRQPHLNLTLLWFCWMSAAVLVNVPWLHARRVGGSRGSCRWFSGRYALEALTTVGAAQGVQLAIAPVLGLSFLAGYRAAQTLYSPLNLLYAAARPLCIPPMTRRSASRSRSLALVATAALLVVALAWAVLVVLVARTPLLGFLLGESAALARPLLTLFGAFYAAQAMFTVASYYVRARGADRASTYGRGALVLGQATSLAVGILSRSEELFLVTQAAAFLVPALSIYMLSQSRLRPPQAEEVL